MTDTIHDTVRVYDTSGDDRVSRLDYAPPGARGTMWVYRASLRAYGSDLRGAHPDRYSEQAAELAKWAALAGDGRLARAAARSSWRATPSRRGLLALAMALTPQRAVRIAARLWSGRRRIARMRRSDSRGR